MDVSKLPALNAALNAASGLLLLLGYFFIRRRLIKFHIICLLAACVTSVLFLTSYLYYHYHHGSTPFQGQGVVRPVYFAILISHTVLAMVIVPLVVVTLARGLSKNFTKHAAIARITLPLWLYVSVTGVVIYAMLYHFYA